MTLHKHSAEAQLEVRFGRETIDDELTYCCTICLKILARKIQVRIDDALLNLVLIPLLKIQLWPNSRSLVG